MFNFAYQAIVLLVQLQADPPGNPVAPVGAANIVQVPADTQVHNVWDFIVKGGPVMIFIGLCSLVALAIIIERFVMIRRARVVPRGLVDRVNELAGDRQAAIELCRNDRSPIARVLETAILYSSESTDVLDRRIDEAGQREVAGLRQRMRMLSALPQVATLLGLLGTVLGMIKTFQVVATTGQALGKTEMLAKGIFEAWTCTAAGLLVAIVVMVAYHCLMGRIDAVVAEMDRAMVDWIEHERVRMSPGSRGGQPHRVIAAASESLNRPAIAPA